MQADPMYIRAPIILTAMKSLILHDRAFSGKSFLGSHAVGKQFDYQLINIK